MYAVRDSRAAASGSSSTERTFWYVLEGAGTCQALPAAPDLTNSHVHTDQHIHCRAQPLALAATAACISLLASILACLYH
jgi:hypothetical protein